MEYLSDEWLDWVAKVDEVKSLWPANMKDPRCAARFIEQSGKITPRNVHARMLWHELRAACFETLGRSDEAEREALAADALYDRIPFASCWAQPWDTLINVALRRNDFAAARRWVDRAAGVTARLSDEYGRPNNPDHWAAKLSEIDEKERLFRLEEDVLADLRRIGAPVLQSEYCKTHPSRQPDVVRLALHELALRGLIRKKKHGRSHMIELAD